MTSARATLRQVAGCWVHERWRAECALRPALSGATGISWRDLHNRNERLAPGSDDVSRVCLWPFSSLLTVARVFPATGARLLARAVQEWPFASATREAAGAAPRVSVLMPVAGVDRRPQFEAVLQNLLGQSLRELEVVVVEHAAARDYERDYPPRVRYVHLERRPGEAFNKSRAFNAAARAARGAVLMLHDADIVVPLDYVRSAVERIERGFEGLQPLRFLFYLDREVGATLLDGGWRLPERVESVGHNYPGGSTVVTREAYWAIGGHDERFEERGGDDNDFLDRLKTRRFFHGGYAPAIHLWHATDPTAENSPRMKAFKQQQLSKPAQQRIAELLESRAD